MEITADIVNVIIVCKIVCNGWKNAERKLYGGAKIQTKPPIGKSWPGLYSDSWNVPISLVTMLLPVFFHKA